MECIFEKSHLNIDKTDISQIHLSNVNFYPELLLISVDVVVVAVVAVVVLVQVKMWKTLMMDHQVMVYLYY